MSLSNSLISRTTSRIPDHEESLRFPWKMKYVWYSIQSVRGQPKTFKVWWKQTSPHGCRPKTFKIWRTRPKISSVKRWGCKTIRAFRHSGRQLKKKYQKFDQLNKHKKTKCSDILANHHLHLPAGMTRECRRPRRLWRLLPSPLTSRKDRWAPPPSPPREGWEWGRGSTNVPR